MPSPAPDRCARRVAEAVHVGSPDGLSELEGKLYAVLTNAPSEELDADVQDALALSQSSYRHVLNALFLVKADDDLISTGLDMTPASVAAYRELFFDPRVFRNAFHVRTYIANLVDDESEEFKSYNHALLEGADALIDRYRVGEAPILEPKQVVARVTREFLSRSREHRGRSLASKIAQESLRCARDAVGASAQLHSIAPTKGPNEDANTQFKLAILAIDMTKPAAEAPVPLHELVRTGPTPDP